jgi:hypothetical protein
LGESDEAESETAGEWDEGTVSSEAENIINQQYVTSANSH